LCITPAVFLQNLSLQLSIMCSMRAGNY